MEKKPKKEIICPNCETAEHVVRVVYGKPGAELMKLAKEGKVILGGCVVHEKREIARCKQCETKIFN